MKAKHPLSSRAIAALLAIVLVIGLLPFSALTVRGATVEHPTAVTITVVDPKGNPLRDALVSYDVVAEDTTVYISDMQMTDEFGCAEILASADFVEGNMYLNYEVTKDNYQSAKNPEPINVETADKDYTVMLFPLITDVTVTPADSLVYNGEAQTLVTVNGAKNGDTVSFTLADEDTVSYVVGQDAAVPIEKTDAGTYPVYVSIVREGFAPLNSSFSVTIGQAKIDGDISIEPCNTPYDGEAHPLVTLNGTFAEGDTVTWYVNGEEDPEAERDVGPMATDIGTYQVRLVVHRDDNYEDVDLTTEELSSINYGKLDFGDLTITANTLTYNGEDQQALTVENKSEDAEYELYFRVGYTKPGEEVPTEEPVEEEWNLLTDESFPVVHNAGSYTIYIYAKALDEHYANENWVEYPVTVLVAKAPQTIAFNSNSLPVSISYNILEGTQNRPADFSAHYTSTLNCGLPLVYSVSNSELATISDTGSLEATAVSPDDPITITATAPESENFEEASVTADLYIIASGYRIRFNTEDIFYTPGKNGSTVATESAERLNEKDKDTIEYSFVGSAPGLNIDSSTGIVTISDLTVLVQAIHKDANGVLAITVLAHVDAHVGRGGVTTMDPADASYTIHISLAEAPDAPLTITGEPNEDGWYNIEHPATVVPPEGYDIAAGTPESFGSSAPVKSNGDVFYLRDASGNITDQIPLPADAKIDMTAPGDLKIEYADIEITEAVTSALTFGLYNPNVEIVFSATDTISGLKRFEWLYSKEPFASNINQESDETARVIDDVENVYDPETGTYSATATAILSTDSALQYRGYISLTAYDKAGNSRTLSKDGDILVIDTVSPTLSVSYPDPQNQIGDTLYYNNKDADSNRKATTYTFTVTEANFDAACATVTVNGVKKNAGWIGNGDVYTGFVTLSEDGTYQIAFTYNEQSENPLTDADATAYPDNTWTSQTIVIDQTPPEVTATFDGTSQCITLEIEEPNFSAANVDIEIDADGFLDKDIRQIRNYLRKNANWEHSEDGLTHTLILYSGGGNVLIDAFYKSITFICTDLATNVGSATIENVEVDQTSPMGLSIDYSAVLTEGVFGTLTMGFFNPSVEVIFGATDATSGVKGFWWYYTRQEGASEINAESDDPDNLDRSYHFVEATRNSETSTTYTATVTLPLKEAQQLRGSISVYAVDKHGNKSAVKTDSKVIVVDSKAPEFLGIKYPDPVNLPESGKIDDLDTLYYNSGSAEVTMSLKEANFFAEDVIVTVTKDGESFAAYPVWSDDNETADKYIGKVTLSGDGEYTLTISYTDKSGNVMGTYTTKSIVIDTKQPVIDVSYKNEDPYANEFDFDEPTREYYAGARTATVTVTEHNFSEDETKPIISAVDVFGNEISPAPYTVSEWTVDETNPDVHICTITYSGEANYTFDIECADLATNKAEDYTPNYFTVDMTAPEITDISYTNVLNTVAGTIFFFQPKATVTATATDNISGVHAFDYVYPVAEGVSSVNTGLNDPKTVIEGTSFSINADKPNEAIYTFEIQPQFNGKVTVNATDRAGNSTELADDKTIIVDNISPTSTVSYNNPVNQVNGISYYAGSINGAITINEANFYAEDVIVQVTKNGVTQTLPVNWMSSGTDIHVGTFTLSEDADYIVTISYTDKSMNKMVSYQSNQMTIDTVIEPADYEINGKTITDEIGGAYKDEAEIDYSFTDQNYESSTVTLTRSRFDEVEDVTDEYIDAIYNAQGGFGEFSIPDAVENDGIYTLTITMTDLAGHEITNTVVFTVNRYGSVYVYDPYLCSLISDGGQYVGSIGGEAPITEDLVITELNAGKLVGNSLSILITRDGEPIDVIYTSNPAQINENVTAGPNGWFEYIYTISKDNFKEDGVYKIVISSTDATGNTSTSVPDNSVDENGAKILDVITFTVDTTPPEFRNIVNLDKPIADRDRIVDGKLTVKYTLIDAGGLAKVEIYLNGELIDEITEFENINNFSGSFDIPESSEVQTVRMVATDLAGNVTDTASESFAPGDAYAFNEKLTVSLNFFVRWYHNTPLFWGSIGGAAVAGGLLWLLLGKKKKDDEEEKA